MNILVVDDHKIFLDSISGLLKSRFPRSSVQIAYNGLTALDKLKTEKIDIVLLDINMPGMNGLDVARHISEDHPSVKIIMLTNVSGVAMLMSLVDYVQGFLFKDVDGDEVCKCIESVNNGEKFYCEGAKKTILDNVNAMNKIPNIDFDRREIRLLQLLASGKTSKEMSTILQLKEKTINSYREGMLKKTKTKNASELIAFAFLNGLI